MDAPIVLTGLAANDPLPGVYLETNFAQGPASGSSDELPAILVGNKTSAGSATVDTTIYGPDTAVACQTEADVIALFGTGSPLHRAWRRWTRINKVTPVYMLAVTASVGAAASLTITFVNAATGNGNVRVHFDEEVVDCGITSGDAITTIATNVAARINEKTHWPFTASPAAGTVVLTMRVAGPRGNYGRIQCQISSGITTTVTQTSDTAFAGGTTADSNTTALTTLAPKRYYYTVSEAEDATNLGALVAQTNSKAAPTVGLRERVFAGNVESISSATTIATGRNAARAEIAWLRGSQWSPFELAAHNAAIFALHERARLGMRTNYAGYGQDEQTQANWHVPAPRDVTLHPTRLNLVAALNNGLTPIGVSNGKTYLVNRITTKSQTSSIADYRIRDAHKVTITDFFSDDLIAKTVLNYSGRKIGNDPAPGKRHPGPTVVTPKLYRMGINRLIDDYADADLVQNPDEIKAGMTVQREANPTTRMGVRIPLQTIDNALQFAIAVDQVA